MAAPKARKLPSGKWNVQVTVHGKRRSITKPTKKEAEAEARFLLAAAETGRITRNDDISSRSAAFLIKMYIEARGSVLSEVSIRDFNAVVRTRFKYYMHKPFNSVNWQTAVDEELKEYSYNTVFTAWRVVLTAAKYAGVNTNAVHVRFPPKDENIHAFFTLEEMHRFQDAIRGDELELACLLGLLSLRKSEIFGLRKKDVDILNGVLHVRHTVVYMGSEGFLERDTTKTYGSRRDIPLILNSRVVELIEASDLKPDDLLVDNVSINGLYRYINKKCDELGLERIGVHGLRHTFASVCWEKDIPIEVCMLYGGWKSERTVRSVYQHLSASRLKEHSLELAKAFERP